MVDDPRMRRVVGAEIQKFQGYLLFAEKQENYAETARTLLRRVRYCFIGLAIVLVLVGCGMVVAMATPGGPEGPESLDARIFTVLIRGLVLGVLLYLVYKWGRLSGSMKTVLGLLDEEEIPVLPDPDGASAEPSASSSASA